MTKKDFESDIHDEESDYQEDSNQSEEDFDEEEFDRELEQIEAELNDIDRRATDYIRRVKYSYYFAYAKIIILVVCVLVFIAMLIKDGISWKHDDYKFFWKSGDLYIAGYYGEDEDITLPSKCFGIPVAGIKDMAFKGCDALTGVTIPDGYAKIRSEAFHSCTSLKNVTIPDSVTTIDHSAFFDCISLESITIPAGVISIKGAVFAGCTELTSILVDDDNRDYCDEDGVLMSINKKWLIQYPPGKQETAYSIPDTVKYIDIGAFYGCKYLESVVIPDSVSHISSSAFNECTSLTSITIPNSVTSIGTEAFSKCASLTSITIPNSVTSIGYKTFSECDNLTVTAPHEPDYYGYALDEGVEWVIG